MAITPIKIVHLIRVVQTSVSHNSDTDGDFDTFLANQYQANVNQIQALTSFDPLASIVTEIYYTGQNGQEVHQVYTIEPSLEQNPA